MKFLELLRNTALAAILFASLPLAAANAARVENDKSLDVQSVTVLAASSMTVPITQISKKYSRVAEIDVNAVYDSTSELLRKIEEGDPADIIITSSKQYLERMKEEGLVDPSSVRMIASNRLAIVAVPEFKINKSEKPEEIFTQIHSKALMIIANPEIDSLGVTTVEILENLDMWHMFQKMVVLAPNSSKTIDLIIKGQGAGVVYSTDAILYRKKVVNLATIPATLHQPINYYAAVVAGNNMDKARKYLEFLESKPAKAILSQNGFMVK